MVIGCAQIPFYPQGAQVISYLPQLADGGPASQQWITSFTFVNSHLTTSLNGTVFLYANNGGGLLLDFGAGPVSTFNFTIPPQGTVVFTSKGTSSSTVATTGWAIATSTLPVQAVVQYRYSVNGIPQQGVAALATQASALFRSPASSQTGIAIGNIYSNPISVNVQALNASGANIATTSITLPAFGHASFSVVQIFPSLPSNFRGTIIVSPTVSGNYTVAWTLSTDLGVLASYPPSALNWPISQYERIWIVWQKILNVANATFTLGTLPKLVIDPTTGQINSLTDTTLNEVHIFMNLAELISDSESELGFAIGHEMGHIIQARIGLQFNSNKEYDADIHCMLLALLAGYDPYGAAGVLAKLAMATGDTSLVSQQFDNVKLALGVDLHGWFVDRINMIFQELVYVCSLPQAHGFCANYRIAIHPHFPGSAPL
jgi:hypothetical protein